MRIAHIGPSLIPIGFEYGGALERRILELGRVQARNGHRVFLFSIGAARQEGELSIENVPRRLKGTAGTLLFLIESVRRARKSKADVLHFHSLPEGTALPNGGARRFLSYDFFRFRRISGGISQGVYRSLLARFDCLLPVSQFCLRESMDFWKWPHAPARVLHNGVNLEQFRPDALERHRIRKALGLSDSPTLLYVGRVCTQKGTDLLIDAFCRARKAMPKLQLVVAGPVGQFQNGITSGSKLVQAIELSGGKYLGAIVESELSAVYNACDLFVMPTREDEMFGMAALEAQACGKAVLCSRLGGLPEVIPQTSGLYFEPGNANDLEKKILRFFLDSLWDLASHARHNASRFSWNKISEDLETIYAK